MKFKTILSDPPWPYKGGGPVGNGGRGSQGGKAKEVIQVNALNHYKLMSMDDLKSLPVEQVADDDAHLYLWTTNSFVEEAHQLARAWGFKPKTILTWGKVKKDQPSVPSMKTGYYFRSATEHILFAVRGSLKLKGPCRPTLFLHPRDQHSVKPDYFYELIEEQSPGPYFEMFARRTRPGWDAWGNEVDPTVVLNGGQFISRRVKPGSLHQSA